MTSALTPDPSVLLPWLLLAVLSGALVYLRLQRHQSLNGAHGQRIDGPVARGLSPVGLAAAGHPVRAQEAREARALDAFALALGRLPAARQRPVGLEFLSLEGQTHVEHDGRPDSPVARIFADLFTVEVPVLLEREGAMWPVKVAALPYSDCFVVDLEPDVGETGRPHDGETLALHIRLGGVALDGHTEVRDVGDHGRLSLSLPWSLSRRELRAHSRTDAMDGIGLRLTSPEGEPVRLMVFDIGHGGVQVKIRGSGAGLCEGDLVPVRLDLLGRAYASFLAQVRHVNEDDGVAGLVVADPAGRAALARLADVIDQGRLLH